MANPIQINVPVEHFDDLLSGLLGSKAVLPSVPPPMPAIPRQAVSAGPAAPTAPNVPLTQPAHPAQTMLASQHTAQSPAQPITPPVHAVRGPLDLATLDEAAMPVREFRHPGLHIPLLDKLPMLGRIPLGNVLHDLGQFGKEAAIAGVSAMAPRLTPFIPGTPQHAAFQQAEQNEQADEESRRALEAAEAHRALQPPQQRLVKVVGPDGKETYVPESAAAGMTPPTTAPKENSQWVVDQSGQLRYLPDSTIGTAPPGTYRPFEKPTATKNDPLLAIVGAEPTTPEYGGRTYPSLADAQKAWGNAYEQASTKPSFPRIEPVNNAQNEIIGYNWFTGATGGGPPHVHFVAAADIPGFPTDLHGVIPAKLTASSLTMRQMAQTIQPQQMKLAVEAVNVGDMLGPAKGRWNAMMTGQVGADNPKFSQFLQDSDLYAAALTRTHFGGRSNEDFQKELEKDFRASQSVADFLARLSAASQWVTGYAEMTSNPTATDPAQFGIHTFQNKEHKTVMAVPLNGKWVSLENGKPIS